MKRFGIFGLFAMLLCVFIMLDGGIASALPKGGSSGTYHQNCYYTWVYDDYSGYMEQVYICGDTIYMPAGEEDDVPYEGCYYGEDCYDDYVTDP